MTTKPQTDANTALAAAERFTVQEVFDAHDQLVSILQRFGPALLTDVAAGTIAERLTIAGLINLDALIALGPPADAPTLDYRGLPLCESPNCGYEKPHAHGDMCGHLCSCGHGR